MARPKLLGDEQERQLYLEHLAGASYRRLARKFGLKSADNAKKIVKRLRGPQGEPKGSTALSPGRGLVAARDASVGLRQAADAKSRLHLEDRAWRLRLAGIGLLSEQAEKLRSGGDHRGAAYIAAQMIRSGNEIYEAIRRDELHEPKLAEFTVVSASSPEGPAPDAEALADELVKLVCDPCRERILEHQEEVSASPSPPDASVPSTPSS